MADITIPVKTISVNIGVMGTKLLGQLYALMGHTATTMQSEARANAPWTDRTGNARQGLFAQPYRSSDVVGAVLYHTMPYGIFLETRWAGRYRVIMPTVLSNADRVMVQARGIVGRL